MFRPHSKVLPTSIPRFRRTACGVALVLGVAAAGMPRVGLGVIPPAGSRAALAPLAAAPVAVAPLPAELLLLAADAGTNDAFGYAVAVDGTTAVMGALGDDGNRGAAYVFVRQGAAWVQQQKLVASSRAVGDIFGAAVDVDGDTVIVGARGRNSSAGAAYVFVRSGTLWTQQQVLSGSAGAQFGTSVAVDDNTAIVGAPFQVVSGLARGAATVYTRSGTVWTSQQVLGGVNSGDEFGQSVDVVGDVAIAGAYQNDENGGNSGNAYVYTRTPSFTGTWSLQTAASGLVALAGVDAGGGSRFGFSAALAGSVDRAVVGARDHTHSGIPSGSAYVFRESGGVWSFEAELVPSDASLSVNAGVYSFGNSVDMNAAGDAVLVGAPLNFTSDDVGAGYLYERSGTAWQQTQLMLPTLGDGESNFGYSVALGDAAAVVGGPSDDTAADGAGAVVIYQKAPTDLRIQKSEDKDPVNAGAELIYTLTVTNVSAVTATAVVVSDTLPALVTYVADTAGCSTAGLPTLTCSLPDIAPGASRILKIRVRVATDLGGAQVMINTASVASAEPDTNSADNFVTEGTFLLNQNDLAITKADSVDPVFAGQELLYTVTVFNRSDATATGVVVTDTLPASLIYLGNTASCATGALPVLVCNLANIAPGGSRSFQVKTRVPETLLDGDPDGTVVLLNKAEVRSNLDEGNWDDNVVTEGTFAEAMADLAVTKTDSPDPVMAGEEVIYTVRVRNNGPNRANGVVITDTLPVGVQYFANSGGCDATALPQLVCQVPDIAAGASRDVAIKVRVPALFVANEANGTKAITNTVLVSSLALDTVPQNNFDREVTFVQEKADLRVLKMSKPDNRVQAGAPFTYTIFVENLGPSAARNVSIRDEILSSGNFTLVSSILDPNLTDAGPFAVPSPMGGSSLEFDLNEPLPPLAVNAGGRWVIQLVVQANAAQDVNNVVTTFTRTTDRVGGGTVTGTPDPNLANNTAVDFIHVADTADLVVSKSGTPNPVTAGHNETYTLTVMNNGPSAAVNVRLEDHLPPFVEVVSITGSSFTTGSTTTCVAGTPGNRLDPARCVFSAVGLGDTAFASLVVRLDPSFPLNPATGLGLLHNTVVGSSAAFDPILANNLAATSTTVNTSANLSVTKTGVGTPVAAGTQTSYEIGFANAGPSTALRAVVTDLLPVGFEAVSAFVVNGLAPFGSAACHLRPAEAAQPAQVSCEVGNLPPTAGGRIVITARVRPEVAAGNYTNAVSIAASTPDPVPGNNNATFDTTVNLSADLAVRKAALQGRPVAGDPLVYSVTVSNHGPSDAPAVQVVDMLPAGVAYLSDTDSCVQGPPGTLTCLLGTLPAGQSFTFSITVLVDANLPPGTVLTNMATVSSAAADPNSANNKATSRVVTTTSADLRVVKFGKPDASVRAGDRLTYTVLVDNLGPSYAHSVQLRDELVSSGRFNLVSLNANVGGNRPAASCAPTAPQSNVNQRLTLTCSLGAVLEPFGPGLGVGRWTLEIVVQANETSSINNVASATASDPDPDPSNNLARVEHDITDVANLALTKTGAPDPVVAGQSLTWVLSVTNAGPSTAQNVVVYDRLPPGVVVTGVTNPTGQCATGTAGNAADRLTCGLGTLPVGATRSVTIAATVQPDVPAGTVLDNDALVVSDLYDPNTADNFATKRTTVAALSNLAVAKTGAPNPVVAGNTVSYAIVVTNSGPSRARNVQLTDFFVSGGAFLSLRDANFQGGLGSCYQAGLGGPDVRCTLGDVPVGGAVRIDLTFHVDPAAPPGAMLDNQVALTAASPLLVAGDTSESITVAASADLTVTKSVDQAQPVAGESFQYTVTVVNGGPSLAKAVLVVDTLPAGVTYIVDSDACVQAPVGTLSCTVGDLPPGAVSAFTVTAEVKPDTLPGTLLTNTAVVSSTTPDPNLANNTATARAVSRTLADLRVVKFGKPDGRVRAGERLTYTVIVDNLGPSYAHNVQLRDSLVSSGRFRVVSLAADVGGNRPTAACNLGALPVQADQRLTFACSLASAMEPFGPGLGIGRWVVEVVVEANETSSINNVASVTTSDPDPVPGNNVARVEHEITDVADLAVGKTGSPDPVVAGGVLTWVVTLSNAGPSTAENALLYDRLPPGVVVTAVDNPAGQCTTGTPGKIADRLTCGLGFLPAGSTRTVTVTAMVRPDVPAGTVLENDAFAVSDIYDPRTADNFAYRLTTVAALSNLRVEKSGAPNPVVAGTRVNYAIVVANQGPSVARNVQLLDAYTSGGPLLKLLAANFQGGPGFCYQVGLGGPDVRCNLGDLPVGRTVRIDLAFFVDPAAPPGTLLNNTVALGAESPLAVAGDLSESIAVAAVADLAITKRVDQAEPVAGKSFAYTVKVVNHGPSVAKTVVVVDTLPAGISFVVDSDACVEGPAGTLTCTLGDMPPAGEASFTITATVNPNTLPGTLLTNTVVVSSSTPDPNLANNTATARAVSRTRADLRVVKFGKPDARVRAGERLTYTVIVDNLGPSFAHTVQLRDELVSSGRFRLASVRADVAGNRPTAGCTPAAPLPGINQRLTLTCSLGADLEPFGPGPGVGRWVIEVVVEADETSSINNVATVTAIDPDPDPGNNVARVEHEITDVADLAVRKSGSPDPVIAGQALTWVITMSNAGPSTAENTLLYDRLPPGVVVTGVQNPAGQCTTGTAGTVADRLTCGLGFVPAGSTRVVTVTATVLPGVPDGTVLENDVFAVSDIYDPRTADNFAFDLTTVRTSADLVVAKAGNPNPIRAGEITSYDVAYRNDGPSVARSVVLRDVLPPRLTAQRVFVVDGLAPFDSASCHIRSGDPALQDAVSCDLGDLAPGQFGRMVVIALVRPDAPAGTVTNTARISSATPDPSLANNVATFDSFVAQAADLVVTKAALETTPVAGRQLTWRVTVRNDGPSDASAVRVVDTLPAGVTYRIDTDACTQGPPGTLSCPLGNLAVGRSTSFDITVLVNENVPPATVLTNTAVVSATTPDPNLANNTATSRVFVRTVTDLRITKFGKPDRTVRAGERLTYTVVVDNLGPSWAHQVVVTDTLVSSKRFDVVSIRADVLGNRPGAACSPPAPLSNLNQRHVITCRLNQDLEGFAPGNGVGRWVVELVIRAPQTSSVNNLAAVSSIDRDPDPANNLALVQHDVTNVADLAVSKTAVGQVTTPGCPPGTANLANQVTAGRQLTYTVIVRNAGPSTAENVLLYDRLPPGLVTRSTSVVGGSGGACATGTPGDPADKLTCGLGTIGPGGAKTVIVVADVSPGLANGTVLENDAFAVSDIFDPDNDDNFATNLTTVNTVADLSITKADDPDPVVAGELLQYTLNVTNGGPSDARGVVVEDTLPPQATFLEASGAACRLDAIQSRKLTCQVGAIPAGGLARILILTRVRPDAVPSGQASTSILNTATVVAMTSDPCTTNNSASQSTAVNRVDDAFLTKSASPDPGMAGEEVAFTIRFGNHGPSTSTNVTVQDRLPLGFTYLRCEPIDPNDAVSCSVTAGDGNSSQQVVRLTQILAANTAVWSATFGTAVNDLNPGETYAFRLVAKVESGYVLNGRGDSGAGQTCAAYLAATGWPHFAADRAVISSLTDAAEAGNNYDDVCTRVNAAADLAITSLALGGPVAGAFFAATASEAEGARPPVDLELAQVQAGCDVVARGGTITYTLTVVNNGPSDAAQVFVVDQLPAEGVVLDPADVAVTVSRGQVVGVRDDGRIEVIAGNDPNNGGTNQLGRLNAGSAPVVITIRVKVAGNAACGSELVNTAFVSTRRFDVLWPLAPGARLARTPTPDPDPTNNTTTSRVTVACPSIRVKKTVSFNGTCPGRAGTVLNQTGQPVTFCFEIINTGDTYLDHVRIVDRLTTRTGGSRVIFDEVIRDGAGGNVPLAPGETVRRQVTIEQLLLNWDCGQVTDLVTVTAAATNSGRTPLACLPPVRAEDRVTIEVPCAGVDFRLQLPVIGGGACQTWIQVQNVGGEDAMAMMFVWGEPGACPPQAAGPLKLECTGLLRPGSAWSFALAQLPVGARSAVLYSLSAEDARDERGNVLPFGRLACDNLFFGLVGDDSEWTRFDVAYRLRGVYQPRNGPALDFGRYSGEALAATVNRKCPDVGDPNVASSAAYTSISSDQEGARDPKSGSFTFYAPLVVAQRAGLNSQIYIQNSGILCTSIEIWFKSQDNCLRAILGNVLNLSPGETVGFDPNTVAGPDWIGSAWVRSTQPLGLVVDTLGANHFTSYTGTAGDVSELSFTYGDQVAFAPLVYNQMQGWDTAIQVQNHSATSPAKVKVYFLDQGGGVLTTVVDWICPRGSQSFFLPVIGGLPGNWVGSARVESQVWWSPGSPEVEAPYVSAVVLLEKWTDPARTTRREAVAYNARGECLLFDWQLGRGDGGLQSGSAVFAIPLLMKAYDGVTSELAITNLVPKPGFTDFAIFLYDQNGLIDFVCQKLSEKAVEYIDLATWGYVNPRFNGSAVVSATFWEHEVFDSRGGFQRNLVGLGGVAVERVGGVQGGPDVPGDESKAFEAFPVFDFFQPESAPGCPGS